MGQRRYRKARVVKVHFFGRILDVRRVLQPAWSDSAQRSRGVADGVALRLWPSHLVFTIVGGPAARLGRRMRDGWRIR